MLKFKFFEWKWLFYREFWCIGVCVIYLFCGVLDVGYGGLLNLFWMFIKRLVLEVYLVVGKKLKVRKV